MIKVLLIGANSYIAKSFEAYISQKGNTSLQIDKVSASDGKWQEVELSSYDSIIMLSAIVHCKERADMEELYIEVNCRLPVKIARKAMEAGVKQFIFLSTAAVYGTMYSRITIDTKPRPETMYGRSKYKAERQLTKLASESFKIAIVRPPKVYGEGCKGNFVKLEKLVEHMPIFPKFHNKQSMIHINKLCEHIEYLIVNNSEGVYLPQDDVYMDTANMVKKMRANLGKRTLLIPGFTLVIRILMKYNGTLKKMFGDLYYE